MNNIFSYIKKNGDKSIDDFPLNSIDMLVFAQLSYINFETYLHLANEFTSIINLYNNIFELTKNNLYVKNNRKLFSLCINSNRYKKLMVGYIDFINTSDTQYCSMVFRLEGKNFIVFRGTDTSVAGWKEDFNMAVLDAIPSHIRGLEYTNNMFSILKGDTYLIGHSKGGNVATYVSINISSDIQNKIVGIYDFDGPGFKDVDVFNSDKYNNIKDKYHRFVPQDDIIGILLNNSDNVNVVKSYSISILQHDLYSWNIVNDSFKTINNRSFISGLLKESSDLWINNMDSNRKHEMINIVFKIFEDAGIKDVKEFKTSPIKTIKNLFMTYTNDLSKEEKELLNVIIINFINQGVKVVFNRVSNAFNKKGE